MISRITKWMNTHLTSLKGGMSFHPKESEFSSNYPLEGIIGVSLESEDMIVLGFDDQFIGSYMESRINTHLTSLKGGISFHPKESEFSSNYPLEGIIGV